MLLSIYPGNPVKFILAQFKRSPLGAFNLSCSYKKLFERCLLKKKSWLLDVSQMTGNRCPLPARLQVGHGLLKKIAQVLSFRENCKGQDLWIMALQIVALAGVPSCLHS